MSDTLHCWRCGFDLNGLIFPVSRREECNQCGADIHACKMCEYFEDKGRGDCSEERAELVSDREKANFCDYFKPANNAYKGGYKDKSAEAKAKLAALFGDEDLGEEKVGDVAGKSASAGEQQNTLTPAEMAEKKLREMLGG